MDSALPPDVLAPGQLAPEDLFLPPELIPDLDQLVYEDGKAVDNAYVEREYKLLTDPLYDSWVGLAQGRKLIAYANVGWFHTYKQPPLVPDVLVSLDVEPRDPRTKEGRSYIQWVLGKRPDLALEIVSDKTGGEGTYKFDEYARLGVPYYVIYDPEDHLEQGVLRAFELRGRRYKAIDPKWIEDLGLGLTFWEGVFQGIQQTWLRWCDEKGQVLPTGGEKAEAEQMRATKAEDALAILRAQLKELGAKPKA